MEGKRKGKKKVAPADEDEDVQVLTTQEMTEYLLLQKKKRAKVMRRLRRRCCKCWGFILALLVAVVAIVFGVLLSMPPEFKTYYFTPLPSPPTKILIFGASGATGKALISELLALDSVEKVTSLGRRRVIFENITGDVSVEDGYTKHPKLKQVIVDFENITKYEKHFEGHDTVFWALGSTRNKAGSHNAFRKIDHDYMEWSARICKEKGLKHFLLVSSVGADANSWLLYPNTKGKIEETLKSFEFDRLSIFRPSLLIADRDERRMGEAIAQRFFPYISWTLGGSLRKYREISVTTLAKAMTITAFHSLSLSSNNNQHPPKVETFESDGIVDIALSFKK